MSIQKTAAKCTAGAIILAGFVAIGSLFGSVAAMADTRPPASVSTSPSVPPGTTPAPATYESEFRRAFLTEMQAGCVEGLQARGAPASVAIAFCGCLTRHAATLPFVELARIGADPSILEPQIGICRAEVSAPAPTADASPAASASTTPSAPPAAAPATRTDDSEFGREFLADMQAGCVETARANGATASVATTFCSCLTEHAATLPTAELENVEETISESQIQVCRARATATAR